MPDPDSSHIGKTHFDAAPPAGARTGKGRILVLDDEDFLRTLFSKVLSSFGYQVTATKDGSEALGALAQSMETGARFTAAILDLTVPNGTGGQEIIAKMRELDASLPIVATSGSTEDPVMSAPEQYGFDGKLGKPFRREEIGALMESIISGRGA